MSKLTKKNNDSCSNGESTSWQFNKELEALREHRPPWPRQIITLILPTVKMLRLGCERLPTPLKKKKKKKKKVLDHYLHHDLGVLPLLRCLFAHLLILQYPDHHQNLISSSLYYSGSAHKISSQSVHNVLSNVVHRQTDRQTDRQTNQRYQKHNLLCQGGNERKKTISSEAYLLNQQQHCSSHNPHAVFTSLRSTILQVICTTPALFGYWLILINKMAQ